VRGARRAHSSRIAPSSGRASAAEMAHPRLSGGSPRRSPSRGREPLDRSGHVADRTCRSVQAGRLRLNFRQTHPPGVLLDTPAHFSRAVCFTHQPRRIRRESSALRCRCAPWRLRSGHRCTRNASKMQGKSRWARPRLGMSRICSCLRRGWHLGCISRHPGTALASTKLGRVMNSFALWPKDTAAALPKTPRLAGCGATSPLFFYLAKRGRTAL